MGVNRSTTNDEVFNDITLTVAPLNGGAVGINQPNPELGTFQIENTYVRTISGAPINGDLKTPNFQNTIANQENSSITAAQFYREGSRVYMDGKLVQIGTWTLGDYHMTLPVDFRPLKTERFLVSCNFQSTLAGSPDYKTCEIRIHTNGNLYINKVMNPDVNNNSATGTLLFIEDTTSGTYFASAGSWFSLAGVNFRVA